MANIKDVARLANVSVATVSRVINNKGYISEHTRGLVMDAIEELNYVPNEIARSLNRNSSKIIGIILPDLKNEFFNDMISGMEEIILQNGYKTMLCTSKEDPEREKKYLQMFSTNKVAGLIICANLTHIDFYKKMNIPVVTIERMISSKIPSITTDNLMGGEIAARQLVKRNCRHIVHFRGPSTVASANERSKGFFNVLKNYPDITVYHVELEFVADPSEKIRQFLSEHPQIDGIFAASDFIAAKTLQCLKDLGIQVPNDVQLIGYDNVSICEITDPTLSTIAQPTHDMGQLATTKLFKLLQNKKIEKLHTKLSVEFIERKSTLSLS